MTDMTPGHDGGIEILCKSGASKPSELLLCLTAIHMPRSSGAQLLDLPDDILDEIFMHLMTMTWNFADFGLTCKRMMAVLLRDRARVAQASSGKFLNVFAGSAYLHAFWCLGQHRNASQHKEGLLRNAGYQIKRGRFHRIILACSLTDCHSEFDLDPEVIWVLNEKDFVQVTAGVPAHKLILVI